MSGYGPLLIGGALLVNVVVFAAISIRRDATVEPLPTLGLLPDFALVNQHGAEVGLASLANRIWVADFFFTTCAGPCPIMSSKMAALQHTFKRAPQVHLVSITVNPEVDTPDVLLAYAGRYHAAHDRWTFLSGSRDEVTALALDGFHLGAGNEPIHHSTYFTLVDGEGRLRGYYDSTDPRAVDQLVADIQQLLVLL